MDGTSRSSITTMFVPEHFASPWPKASPCPQQTLNITKARSHNVPQRETTGTASAPGPCNCLQVWLSHTGEISIRNMSFTLHRGGQQLPLPWQWKLTQNTTKSMNKPFSVTLQQQAAIRTWPTSSPTQGRGNNRPSPCRESAGLLKIREASDFTYILGKQMWSTSSSWALSQPASKAN